MIYRNPGHRARTPQGSGRFPGFDVTSEADRWDAVTAGTVLRRLGPAGPCGFFTETEAGIAGALLDRLLAQDGEPRIPVLSLIDARLLAGETDGWHHDDLPEDGQAWRDTLRLLNADALDRFGAGFSELGPPDQRRLVRQVQEAAAAGAQWRQLSADHVWSLWTRYACTAFYSHPWAWNEIGFPGPAYPRGYLNLGVDARDRHEVADHDDVDPVPFAARAERARRGGGPS